MDFLIYHFITLITLRVLKDYNLYFKNAFVEYYNRRYSFLNLNIDDIDLPAEVSSPRFIDISNTSLSKPLSYICRSRSEDIIDEDPNEVPNNLNTIHNQATNVFFRFSQYAGVAIGSIGSNYKK